MKSSPFESTPNELMLPSAPVDDNSAVCSMRSEAVASPLAAIDSAIDHTRPWTKSAKK